MGIERITDSKYALSKVDGEKKIRQNLKAVFGLGFQYINLPAIVWSIDNDYELPIYVSSRVDEWVDDLNDYKYSISNVIPTLKVGLTYMF